MLWCCIESQELCCDLSSAFRLFHSNVTSETGRSTDASVNTEHGPMKQYMILLTVSQHIATYWILTPLSWYVLYRQILASTKPELVVCLRDCNLGLSIGQWPLWSKLKYWNISRWIIWNFEAYRRSWSPDWLWSSPDFSCNATKRLTYVVLSQMSQLNLVQTFMPHWGWIVMSLVIPWRFIKHLHQVKNCICLILLLMTGYTQN